MAGFLPDARRFSLAALSLWMAVALAGCSDGGTVDQNVSNETDQFGYSATLDNKSGRVDYEWSNSGSKASVNWAANVRSGAVSVVVQDPTGKEVFHRTANGADATAQESSSGSPGTWKVVLDFSNTSGTVALDLKRK